jgi:hypothetical protein
MEDFFIQDPSYENSMYLHEAILSAFKERLEEERTCLTATSAVSKT